MSARVISTPLDSFTKVDRTSSSPSWSRPDDQTTEIPESGYTFSVLKRAQALGDVETLEAHGRRTVRLDIKIQADAAAVGT